MQMGDDDFGNIIWGQAQWSKGGDRIKANGAHSRCGLGIVVSRIDQNVACSITQQPHEIIHCMRCVVIIIKYETVCTGAGIAISIFNRMNLPDAHWCTVLNVRTSLVANISAVPASNDKK